MSLTEIRNTIDRMTEEERFFAAAYLKHLAEVNDPVRQSMLGERMRRMEEGKKFSIDQIQRIHETLTTERL
jgi:hypothetical protein